MLLFGGESSEHEVSIASARNVFAAMDDTKYDIILTYIDKTGRWCLIEDIADQIDVAGVPQIIPILGTSTLMIIPSYESVSPDVILPILHGMNGEDGTIQGLVSLLHIPIVGCGVEASTIAMDKLIAKRLLEHAGIQIVPYVSYEVGEQTPNFHDLSAKLGDRLFIKPACGGSSVGVNKVSNADEFDAALTEAGRYCSSALIEKAIHGRELEMAVLGKGDAVSVSCAGEIVPDRSFYDYDSKYSSNSQTRVIIPADIPEQITLDMQRISKLAFSTIKGSGLARIDFFLDDDGQLYLNEINTMPGFTNISMYPKLWRASGMTYGGLIDRMISLALER